MSRVIAVVSGGLDSTVMCYSLRHQGHDVVALTFQYGQRHSREVEAAKHLGDIGVEHVVLDLPLARILRQNALTGGAPVPDGHYASETMRVTVVPNRNAIMLAIAFAVAVDRGASAVATAVHGGDHFIYPDCRPEFAAAFAQMQSLSLDGIANVELMTPFIHATKADIVRLGAELGVPFEKTWSCYRGGAVHCGTCGTCFERREAFAMAGVIDPTLYADREALASTAT